MYLVSKRLEVIGNYIKENAKVADVGTDHGHLAIFAVKERNASLVVASDVNEFPLMSARRNVINEGLKNIVSLRLGNGLDTINPEEVDTIVVSGMGGQLIRDILENGKDKLTKVENIIVQPNVGSHILRKWLMENGYEIKDEQIIKDAGIIYEIIYAEIGTMTLNDTELMFGPVLLSNINENFIEKHKNDYLKAKKILKQIPPSAETKVLEFTNRLKMYEDLKLW